MPECPGTQHIVALIRWVWRALACSLFAPAGCCPGPGSRCAVRLMAACESLHTTTDMSSCACGATTVATDFRSASLVALTSVTRTSICPVRRQLRKTVQQSPFWHTTLAPTVPSSFQDPSIHHVQVPDFALLSFLSAHSSAALLAAASSSITVVLTAGFSRGSGQQIVSSILPRV